MSGGPGRLLAAIYALLALAAGSRSIAQITSGFSAGYIWIPLALPCAGLAWLILKAPQPRRDRESHTGRPPNAAASS